MEDDQVNDLEARLASYGASILSVAEDCCDNKMRRHVSEQLLRAGTAAGAHYSEARCAQSRDDFVHKISLAAKEARESLYWLRVVRDANLVDRDLSSTVQEASELVAILYSSLQTARRNSA